MGQRDIRDKRNVYDNQNSTLREAKVCMVKNNPSTLREAGNV